MSKKGLKLEVTRQFGGEFVELNKLFMLWEQTNKKCIGGEFLELLFPSLHTQSVY